MLQYQSCLLSPYFSVFYLAQSLNSVSKPYNLNLLSFWRIALIIPSWIKQTTFAIGFLITGVQRWFMNRKRMFNRKVRKYNWQTTKKLGFMTRLVTIEQLLEKPICMMSGQEFVLLLQNVEKQTAKAPAEVVPEKHYEYGIAGIAKIFGCSIPTANRIKKSGVIDAAITQVNRKITVDSELALSLAKEAGTTISIKK